ncbi:MAG TPA: hypothetical protein VFH27_03650 [Longimicrobiaceae bacterium]|nr:hypothetical protein [Longimicrobiaceae bacterium]
MTRSRSISPRRPAGRLLALALACAAGAVACGGGKGGLGPVARTAVLYDDDAGGLRDSVRLVVRDAVGLERLWRQATAGQSAPPPAPMVNWGREMVVAVAAGRMTPNDRIAVDSAGVRREPGADGREREVLAVLVRTTQGCERFRTAAAFPVSLVRVPRYAGPVVFVERRERAAGCAR